MPLESPEKQDPARRFYLRQNKVIHEARAQIGLDLNGCRELARHIGGRASISSLSINQRWRLIEALKNRGARVRNPSLSEFPRGAEEKKNNASNADICPQELYSSRLKIWNERFRNERPGFASNRQLAWIEALWMLDFDDGRIGRDKGLRGFIWRQTRKLKDGPVSDLAFLKRHHVESILTPLKIKGRKKMQRKEGKR